MLLTRSWMSHNAGKSGINKKHPSWKVISCLTASEYLPFMGTSERKWSIFSHGDGYFYFLCAFMLCYVCQLSWMTWRCNMCINIWICDGQRSGNILLAENGWHPLISQCAKRWAAQMRCFVHVSAAHGEGSSSTHDLSVFLCCRVNLTFAIFFF